jgi:1-acyl-sn-glycerol-3-phosphate acyltransferase
MKAIARFIYYKLMGWKLNGTFPAVDKCVTIVVPHTSWVDFFVGLLVRKIIGKEMHYVGKKELFKPPFGWFFKWMGGAPIDRGKSKGYVDAISEIFQTKKVFRLTIAPEGTRKKVAQWKTGFYYIAKQAQVPIVLVAFDFGKKEVKISGSPFYPTDNLEADFAFMKSFYKGVVGKVPEYT